MSRESVEQLITRALNDPQIRQQLQFNPKEVLKDFDLTSAEVDALKSNNAARLKALGLSDELSKAGSRLRLSHSLRWP